MIAPYRKTKNPSSSMRRARRMVASTMLSDEAESRKSRARVPGWKAWLFAAWAVVVTVAYFAYMSGWS